MLHMKSVAGALVAAAAVLVFAAPASANSQPTTGPKIGFFFPPTTFAANSPFHVEQGFACDLTDAGCIATQIGGQSSFALYVDGVLQSSTVDVDAAGGSGGFIEKQWLTNVPSGLAAGIHTFIGVWTVGGIDTTRTITVTFT